MDYPLRRVHGDARKTGPSSLVKEITSYVSVWTCSVVCYSFRRTIMSDILSPGDQAKLRTLWNAVLTTQSDQHTQAFLGGRNYRLNVAAAFKAIWQL